MKQLDYSKITDQVFVGRTPRHRDYKHLQDQGVGLVINMRAEWPQKLSRQKLIKDIWVPSFDNPLMFVGQKRLLANATRAKQVLDEGGKVYVFCRKGRHRSVTMASAILMLQGHDLESLPALFAERRPTADLRMYHVRKALQKFARNQKSL